MYVDYLYYHSKYGGMMPGEAFTIAENRATTYIRYITYLNGDVFAEKEVELIKQAVCAAADICYHMEQERQRQETEGKPGAVKSENNDGFSASFVVEQVDGQTAEELLRKKIYDAVYPYLLPTGWLSRKVGCCHDHKCGYHGL
ncbi:MAG: hypothetical protein RR875_09015 [Clostridium sp.]